MKLNVKIFFGLLLLAHNTFAQTDAKAILAAVSKKFNSYNAIKTNFTLKVNNLQSNTSETLAGTLYLKAKENKYKVMFPQQEIYADGKNQWTYIKEDNEVQLNKVSTQNDDALNPANLFGNWDKGYKSRLLGETKLNGMLYQNIELVPLASRSFSKIKLSFSKDKKQLNAVEIFDKNGGRYLYTINKLTVLNKIDDATFTYNKSNHPGAELVDLR